MVVAILVGNFLISLLLLEKVRLLDDRVKTLVEKTRGTTTVSDSADPNGRRMPLVTIGANAPAALVENSAKSRPVVDSPQLWPIID